MQFAAHVSHTGQTLSDYMVSEPINRDIRKSIARCLVCWSKLNKRTVRKQRPATRQACTGHPKPPQFQHVSLMGLSEAQCSGRASPTGLSAKASSTREPQQKRKEQQYRRWRRTYNLYSFNAFPWWGSPTHNAPLSYINHKRGVAPYQKFVRIPSCMERWGLSITKDNNTIWNAIYPMLIKHPPPLNLQLCFLKVLVVEFCTFKTWLSTIADHLLK